VAWVNFPTIQIRDRTWARCRHADARAMVPGLIVRERERISSAGGAFELIYLAAITE
jgi:hypothetical protein